MDYRNPVYNQFGAIDLEIEHPAFGWIPFTASPDDPEELGRAMFAEAAGTATAYSRTVPTLEETRAAKLSALSDQRWKVEIGGILVNGAPVRTDANSQAKITGAVALFKNDPELQAIDWEAQPGIWVTLDAVTMTAIAVAVGRHVQACFSRARALSAEIGAASDFAALEAVDIETGWPR
ncbi:DUF4376 domain-containing protein [Mesorhizobium sp.]|uniref:DUF4376 domain-containing protein n=1 Tax=Mesorhizobium sp. TaxID=1871066 RepID=UPI000FE3822D|nr:DUF4376 domain-containing protein [Mesorhizobium sp.]RWK26834.1 MAG: DUF4376 domain-containing protein [Mesorhizobium sp.]TIQ07124.1 MAG: DUF4376 domain-containing protein [Mesorhizobium sp.]